MDASCRLRRGRRRFVAAGPGRTTRTAHRSRRGASRQTRLGRRPITVEQYREWRLRYIERRQTQLAVQLAAADLQPRQRARLEQVKAYYDWLAGLPAADRDRRFRERFDQIDANHDGTIDPGERAAWRDKQRAFYGRGRGAAEPAAAREAR